MLLLGGSKHWASNQSYTGGFPNRVVSHFFRGRSGLCRGRTLSRLFLVGAVDRPRRRKRTNRENPRTLTLQPLLFFRFPCFFRFPIFLAFLCVFPLFSKDFRGFREEKNPCCFGEKPLLFFQKSKEWRVRGVSPEKVSEKVPEKSGKSRKRVEKVSKKEGQVHCSGKLSRQFFEPPAFRGPGRLKRRLKGGIRIWLACQYSVGEFFKIIWGLQINIGKEPFHSKGMSRCSRN